MPKLPNPNTNQPYDEVLKDSQGNPTFGVRKVDGNEEIVHIPTGNSNFSYWQPEVVMSAEGCDHNFDIIDINKREIECRQCHFTTTFHPSLNFFEEKGKYFVEIKGKKYSMASNI